MSERARENVAKVSAILNNFSFSDKDFCTEMSGEHRTLQQSFTRLCIAWIATCASKDYRFDGRNEASHNICKEIVDAYNNDHTHTSRERFEHIGLPLI